MTKFELRDAVLAAIDGVAPEVQKVSANIHANPEVAFQETKAAGWLSHLLAGHQFEVERGVADIATAFRAKHRGGRGPTIAFLAEYDALPGIGHGCGHNLICTAACAAAIGLQAAWPELPGSIVVMGTPGEEGGGGKILMLERGAFDGVDVSMMFHPANRSVANYFSLAASHLAITFAGRAAHSAAEPWRGRNAADAAMLFFSGVNALRQHMQPDVRVHGVILEAGAKANIVPERSAIDFMVRAERTDTMEAVLARVVDVARGAALMTGTTMRFERGLTYLDAIRCPSLVALTEAHFAQLVVDAVACDPGLPRASGDAANVSHKMPTVGFLVSIADESVPGHSEQNRDAAITARGQAAMITAAKVMALLAVDILDDPELFRRIGAEHQSALGRDG